MKPTVQIPFQDDLSLTDHAFLTELRSVSPDQRKAKLNTFIRELFVEFLALDSLDDISEDQDFVELGGDSMQAVDFKSKLEKQLDCSLRSTLLFDHPRLDLLTDYLINEVLDLPPDSVNPTPDSLKTTAVALPQNTPQTRTEEIAIVAMAGIFPEAENAQALWSKAISGEPLQLPAPTDAAKFGYARITTPPDTAALQVLGITDEAYWAMDRQQQLLYRAIADAMTHYGLSKQDLGKPTTGIFIAGQQTGYDDNSPYQIPIANKVSFQLNLKGPSETINTFCTSAYVALHRAAQSLRSGECQQAIVGGVNLIDPQAFALAVSQGVYDPILSPNNQTHSFCAEAAGYVRSEGAGILLLKPLDKAQQDGNPILAVIKGSAVHHGGRGYSYEAPNPQGLKETIRLGLERANVTADSIDYIEAHGIGNVMADALELGALNQVYRNSSQHPNKNWHISCIKPSIGHPELASGIACIIKALKAFEHQILPGIANLGALNHELPDNLALTLQAANQVWPDTASPKRIALNSYAIGGMNAHIILEKPSRHASQTVPEPQRPPVQESSITSDTPTSEKDNTVLAQLLQDVLGLDLPTLDTSLSMIDFGFDSIKVMQFVAEVNEALGLDIKFSEVLGIDDFDGFFQLIDSERANTSQTLPVRQEPVSQASGQTSAPLSEVQKGLWYINETSQDPIGFNTPITFKLAQKPDRELMRQALAQTLEEHPILRASFVQDENTEDLRQVIRPTAERTFCQAITMEAGQTLPQALTKLMRIHFNLKDDPLVKLYLLSDSNNSQHYAFFVIHHIVFDGTSGGLFIKSFWDKYHAHCAGKPLPTKAPELAFFDFAQWEQAYLNSPKAQNDKAWWQEQLGGQSPTINLPYDHLPQSGQATLDIGSQHLKLAETTYNAIKQLATNEKITLSVWFLAAFQIFLYKLTQEKNIAVTTPTRGRPKLAHENSMGCYINLMVTRCELSAEHTFLELAQHARQQFAKNLDHAFYPFPKILSDLGLTLTNPKEVPFPVAYAYQNFFDDILYSDNAAYGVETLLNEIHQQTEDNFTLEIYDFSDDLQINFNYKRNLFDDSTISRLLRYFENLLAEIVANPKQSVKHYNLLPEDERRHILEDFNQSTAEFPRGYCIHELFVQQAQQTPNHTALVFQGETMTYAELANRSHALALYLQSFGIAPDGLIAVCMDRSFDMIVAVMAILQAGAAYLPISPTNAPERIAYMLQNGAVKLLLTQSHLQDKLTGLETQTPYQTLAIDSPETLSGIVAHQNGTLQALAKPENLAYVIYTSGTTGTPKGVMIRHESLVNMSDALVKSYGITTEDRILQFASLSFDMAVEEIFPYLMAGAGIVIREEDDMEAERFYRLVTSQKVTILNLVPMYYNVIDELDAGQKQQLFTQVRHITFGGDALPDAVLNTLRKYPVRIFNVYGPSEYTVNTSIADVTDSAVNHIGKPIGNTQVYVLGDGLNVMPVGVAGELHIAGVGIAKGYLNQPELTAEKFLPNPFGPGTLYKSGDMMRWLPDGTLQPLGRTDDQVKIRGFRVELGEIERVLLTYPNIDSAAVVTQQQGQGKQLVAFYVSAADIDELELKNHLRKRLPDYMIPAALVKLDTIPVTTNGKLDRKKLEASTVSVVSDTPYAAPANTIEATLVEIWQTVLNVPQIGIHDNFFALGGHSLLAIQIVLRTNKKLAVNLSVSAFFDAGDIQHLAQVIAHAETATEDNNVGHFIGQSEEVIF